MHDERVYGERAFRAGAIGYVMKDQPWEHLLRAIRAALSGQLAFSRTLARTWLGQRDAAPGAAQALTDRELEVFAQLGRGLRLREVAEGLNLSP
jgi:DNA-binding NarL/FixJ family response regulator